MEALAGLAQRREVRLVDRLEPDLLDEIEDVEEVLLRVHADALDRRHDLADHALARGGVRSITQFAKVGEQLPVDEVRNEPIGASTSAARFAPRLAAQSRHRYGAATDCWKLTPTASASSASSSSRSSRIRRKRTKDSSGTY